MKGKKKSGNVGFGSIRHFVAESSFLDHLQAALHGLIDWFENRKVPYVVIGGVAASILGRPRVTRDIDAVVLIPEEDWEVFLRSGKKFGFEPRRSDCLLFARSSRVLLMRHSSSEIEIDISLGGLPFEEVMISQAQTVSVAGKKFKIPLAEDLMVMKAVASRPQDLKDIQSLLDAQPGIDLKGAEKWIRQFATALESPEILDEFRSLIRKKSKAQNNRRKKN